VWPFSILFLCSKIICSTAIWVSRKEEKEEDGDAETWKINYTNFIPLEQNIIPIRSHELKNLLDRTSMEVTDSSE